MTIDLAAPPGLTAVVGRGQTDRLLSEAEIAGLIESGLGPLPLDGRRVLLIVPDLTRTMPLPMFFRHLLAHLLPRVAAADVLVALGTHPPLTESELLRLVGLTPAQKAADYPTVRLLNHAWQDPDALITLGTISAAEMDVFSGGRLRADVPVTLNRLILDYDHLLICGPVFPHEIAGFSGGNKYFFPGIAGAEVIDYTHWLGALITCGKIIGVPHTPIRAILDRAAALIPRPRHALCSVVTGEGVHGLYIGTPEAAWAEAAALSSQIHIQWHDRPYRQVLAVLPEMYTELWVGGKGMYKTEPVIADGGELIIYAPHLREISVTHGRVIKAIGYHVRDYFTKQWDRFKHYPRGVIGHCTYVRGGGT